jgi:hypothetical protein
MKIISATVFAALFAASQARFLDASSPLTVPATNFGNPTFASTLNCGQCIGTGNTYCIQKSEYVLLNGVPAASQQKCVASGTSDASMVDTTWSCSNAFSDRVYSKYVCQYNTAQCGVTNSVALATTNSTQNVTITNLQLGQTCFYTVKAACGAPAFKPDSVNLTRFEFEYVTFADSSLNSSDAVIGYNSQNSNTTTKRQASPVAGIPRRDHYFNASLGGNQVVNQNVTAYTNSSFQGSVFGQSGRYDKLVGGRKVYGNPTQGDLQQGNLTNQSAADCAGRNLYLAVTAITDLSSTNVTFSSVSFYRPPVVNTDTSNASVLSITFAAVLGLISLAFF